MRGQEAASNQKIPYFKKLNKGLSVRLYKPGGGTLTWLARIRHDGSYRTKFFNQQDVKTYGDAVNAATAEAKKVRAGESPTREENTKAAKGAMTIRALVEEYVSQNSMKTAKGDRYDQWAYEARNRCKTYVYSESKKGLHYHPVGAKAANQLTKEDIQTLQQTMLDTNMTAESVNRNFVSLRAALNYGLANGYLPGAPWKAVSLLEEAEPDDKANSKQYYNKEAREAVLEAADEHLEPLLRCMYVTGCRPSEARRLTVGDVEVSTHEKEKYVRFKTFKGNRMSGRSRKFPLTNGRLEFFKAEAKGRKKDEPLFMTKRGLSWSMASLGKTIRQLRAKIEEVDDNFESYCWRHAWITDLIKADVKPLSVAKLAGTSLKYIQDNYTLGDDSLADQLPEQI